MQMVECTECHMDFFKTAGRVSQPLCGKCEANEYLRYEVEILQKENDMLCNKLADIRDLFDQADMEAEGHGMDDAIGSPYAVACYAENKLKRLIAKVERFEKTLKEIAGDYEHCEYMSEMGFMDYYNGYEKTDKAKEALEGI